MNIFRFLTWEPMAAEISKRYSSYKSQPNVVKLVLNFPFNGPHKTTLGIFEFELLSFNDCFFFFENFEFTKNVDYLKNGRS